MNDKKNIVASVLARLRNNAKSSGAPFLEVFAAPLFQSLAAGDRHRHPQPIRG